MSRFWKSALLSAAALAPAPAFAQQFALNYTSDLVVTGARSRISDAEADAQTRPGGVDVVPAEEFQDRYAVNFRDTLAFTPGVIAQPRFGEEVRLSIRGSGLNNNAHLRGVEILFDGVPLNGADGFGDFQEFDPLFASHMVVYRGANAFASGASTLGGAIELAPITARDEQGGLARIEGGSYGTSRVHGRYGVAGERYDLVVAGTWQNQDGYRDQAQQSNGRLYVNAGARWNERFESRLSVLGNDVNQEIPGSLTLDQALSNPRQANAANALRDYGRDINSWRAVQRNVLTLGEDEKITFGAGYTDRHLYHPISIALAQYVQEALAFARYDGTSSIGNLPLSYSAGVRWRDGRTSQHTYLAFAVNPNAHGALTGSTLMIADGYDAFAEARLTLLDDFDVIIGANSIETHRDYRNRLDNSKNDTADFSGVSEKFGLLWRATDTIQVFANYAGSYEPPNFSQLTQGGLADFYPIEAQEGETFEIGARGSRGPISFELVYYDARLENEFVTFTTNPGNPAATRNAPRTVHRGIEAGVEARLFQDLAGMDLTARATWTHSEFKFDNDPTYGDNTLAGAPEDLARFALALSAGNWRLAPNVEWQSDDTYVDYANTLRSPGHTIWGLSASWDANPQTTFFFEGRNLTNEHYVSMVSTIANAKAPGANLAVFTPGDGRALYGGVRVKFGQ